MSPLGREGVGPVGTEGSDLVPRGTVGLAILRRLRTPALLTFALAALALLARSGATVSLDVPLAETIRGMAQTPLGAPFALLDQLAGVLAWTVLVALAAILSWRVRPRGAALFLLGDLSAELATAVLKAVVDRPRPPSVALADLVPTASFPSGHIVRTLVALSVAAALVLPPRWRRWAVGAVALFELVLGLARVASGEHWPSDVIGGYLLGGLLLSVLVSLRDGPRWRPARWVPGLAAVLGAALP